MVDVATCAAGLEGMPVVDAHQHFWDPVANYHPWLRDEPMVPFRYGDYSAIRKPFLPPDYLRESSGWNVVKTVYVETEWDPADPLGETRYIHGVAERFAYPNAVVAQAWLDHPDATQLLADQAAWPLVRSVRHKPRSASTPHEARRGQAGGMDDPRWRAGYAALGPLGLMFDLQTPWWHLDAAAALARDFPHIPLLLNHTGLPSDRSAAGMAGWRAAMHTLAAQPNTFCKISGLGLRGQPWRGEANAPVVRDAIAIFGVERCMFASNFPVDSVVGSFDTIYRGFAEATEHLGTDAQRQLFHDNAVRIYRL